MGFIKVISNNYTKKEKIIITIIVFFSDTFNYLNNITTR